MAGNDILYRNMNWNNLKENKCPKCGKNFNSMSFQEKGMIKCFNPEQMCDFRVREFRYNQIVSNQITQDLERKYEEEYERN